MTQLVRHYVSYDPETDMWRAWGPFTTWVQEGSDLGLFDQGRRVEIETTDLGEFKQQLRQLALTVVEKEIDFEIDTLCLRAPTSEELIAAKSVA